MYKYIQIKTTQSTVNYESSIYLLYIYEYTLVRGGGMLVGEVNSREFPQLQKVRLDGSPVTLDNIISYNTISYTIIKVCAVVNTPPAATPTAGDYRRIELYSAVFSVVWCSDVAVAE